MIISTTTAFYFKSTIVLKKIGSWRQILICLFIKKCLFIETSFVEVLCIVIVIFINAILNSMEASSASNYFISVMMKFVSQTLHSKLYFKIICVTLQMVQLNYTLLT